MHNEDDLSRALEDLEKDSQDKLRRIFRDLESDLDAARKAKKIAQDQTKKAEEKYHAALELQEGQYSIVIRETFDEPKKELAKNISKYSLVSILITLTVATLSLIFTAYVAAQNTLSLEGDVREIWANGRETHDLLGGLVGDLDFLSAVSDGDVLEIVRHLEKWRGDFDDYQTITNLERAYKINPVNSSGFYYYQYRMAFRQFGLDEIPTMRELQEWDDEAYGLYDKWYEYVSDRGRDGVPLGDRARKWDSFKSKDDGTRYNWVFTKEDISFYEMGVTISRKRGAFLAQLKKNEKLLP